LYRCNLQALTALLISMFGRDISQENTNTMKNDAQRFKNLSAIVMRTVIVIKQRLAFSETGNIYLYIRYSTTLHIHFFSYIFFRKNLCCSGDHKADHVSTEKDRLAIFTTRQTSIVCHRSSTRRSGSFRGGGTCGGSCSRFRQHDAVIPCVLCGTHSLGRLA